MKKFIIILIAVLVISVIALVMQQRKQKQNQQPIGASNLNNAGGSNATATPATALPTQPAIVIRMVSDGTKYPVKQGARGKAVALIQRQYGAAIDGIFGSQTKEKIIAGGVFKSGEVPKQHFQYMFSDARLQGGNFPLRRGDSGILAHELNILLSGEYKKTAFDASTEALVRNVFGTTTVTQQQFQTLGKTVLDL